MSYDKDQLRQIIDADIESGKVRTFSNMRSWVWYMMRPGAKSSEEIMLAVLDGDLPKMEDIDNEYLRRLSRKKIKRKVKKWFG